MKFPVFIDFFLFFHLIIISKAKINGFLSNCNKIKELYDCDQNNQYSKDPELIEIPEVDDNYKSVFKEQSLQTSHEVANKHTNPYKTILNMRTKPQKLFKSSLTKFHDSCLSNSSMRVRAVELLNMNSTHYNQVSYNQIHSLKNPPIPPRFFEKNDNAGKNMERKEVKELSISGFSNRVVKIRNLNEESGIEPVKPLYNEAIPEKKLRPATAAIQRPINKENNKISQNKISPSI